MLVKSVFMYIFFSNRNNTRPGSILWSGQVSQLTGSTNTPISITFSVDNVSYDLFFLNFPIYKNIFFFTQSIKISLNTFVSTGIKGEFSHNDIFLTSIYTHVPVVYKNGQVMV